MRVGWSHRSPSIKFSVGIYYTFRHICCCVCYHRLNETPTTAISLLFLSLHTQAHTATDTDIHSTSIKIDVDDSTWQPHLLYIYNHFYCITSLSDTDVYMFVFYQFSNRRQTHKQTDRAQTLPSASIWEYEERTENPM